MMNGEPLCGVIQTYLFPEDSKKLSQVTLNQQNEQTKSKGRPLNFKLMPF